MQATPLAPGTAVTRRGLGVGLRAASSPRNAPFLAASRREFKHLETQKGDLQQSVRAAWLRGAGLSASFSDDTVMQVSTPRVFEAMVAGAVGGLASRTATAPVDRVRILQQTWGAGAGAERAGTASGLRRTARDVYRREGLRGFWRGNGANLAKVVPQAAVVCTVYTRLLEGFGLVDLYDRPYLRFAAGATSGIVAATVTFPLDVIRTRLAAQLAAPVAAAAFRSTDVSPDAVGRVRGAMGTSAPLCRAERTSSGMLPRSASLARPSMSTPGVGLAASAMGGPARQSPYGTRGVRRGEGGVPGTGDRRGLSVQARRSHGALRLPGAAHALGPSLRHRIAMQAPAASPVVTAAAAPSAAARPALPRAAAGTPAAAAAASARRLVTAAVAAAATSAGFGVAPRSAAARRYLGIVDAARSILRDEGYQGFFKGIRPTVVSLALFVGVQQAGYDLILPQVRWALDGAVAAAAAAAAVASRKAQEAARLADPHGGDPLLADAVGEAVEGSRRHALGSRPTFWHSVIAGGIIGMAAQTIIHPLDTLRRRIQVTRTEWVRPMEALRRVLRAEGVRGLYRGCFAANLKVAPSVAITLTARDAVLGRLQWR